MVAMIVLVIGEILIGPPGMLFAIPTLGTLKVVASEIVFITKNSNLML